MSIDSQEGLGNLRIKLRSGTASDFIQRYGNRQGGAIRPVGRLTHRPCIVLSVAWLEQ